MFDVEDTIAGIATAAGAGLRGILRLSGPGVVDCLRRCFRTSSGRALERIKHPTALAGTLDVGPTVGDLPGDIYLWPTTRSYTRQPAAEFHTLGSRPLLDAALRTFCAAGARLAQPGEFTMRAFLAGRLDLTQAEAVLGVIDAADRSELETALGQLAGGLATPLHELREQLLNLLAHLEAGLDFVEEDIEFISDEELLEQLDAASRRVAAIAEQLDSRGDVLECVRVVLMGWANVGKSSLFNALAEQSAAIVSSSPGTTRDYLTAMISPDRIPVQLIDTAGVEGERVKDAIARAAQQMTGTQHRDAHLQILCLDSTRRLNPWEQATLYCQDHARLIVLTKYDARGPLQIDRPALATSARTGEGIGALREAIQQWVETETPGYDGAVPSTAVRCRDSLLRADSALGRALELVRQCGGEELVAVEVRTALDELGQVVGAVYTDDVLDRIFSRFCIGK